VPITQISLNLTTLALYISGRTLYLITTQLTASLTALVSQLAAGLTSMVIIMNLMAAAFCQSCKKSYHMAMKINSIYQVSSIKEKELLVAVDTQGWVTWALEVATMTQVYFMETR